MQRIWVLSALCVVAFRASGDLPAVETRTESFRRPVASVSERVTRLEQQMGTNTTLQLTQRVEALQQEIQELRGLVEELQNRLPQSNRQDLQSSQAVTTLMPVSRQTAPEEGEQGLYQIAYHQLQAKDYQAARQTLQQLLEEYPTGENAPNAYYWLGEVALIQGNTMEAQKYFETVVTQFPKHTKVEDSLLKMGYIAYSDENYMLSKQLLDKLIKQSPNSSAARLAETRLKKMKKEGH